MLEVHIDAGGAPTVLFGAAHSITGQWPTTEGGRRRILSLRVGGRGAEERCQDGRIKSGNEEVLRTSRERRLGERSRQTNVRSRQIRNHPRFHCRAHLGSAHSPVTTRARTFRDEERKRSGCRFKEPNTLCGRSQNTGSGSIETRQDQRQENNHERSESRISRGMWCWKEKKQREKRNEYKM